MWLPLVVDGLEVVLINTGRSWESEPWSYERAGGRRAVLPAHPASASAETKLNTPVIKGSQENIN